MLKIAFGIYIIQLLVVAVLFGLDHFEHTQVFKTRDDFFKALNPLLPYRLLYTKVITPFIDKHFN
jgi:hypothetical protein